MTSSGVRTTPVCNRVHQHQCCTWYGDPENFTQRINGILSKFDIALQSKNKTKTNKQTKNKQKEVITVQNAFESFCMQSRTDTRTHFKDLGDTADVTNHRSVLLHENDSFLRTVLRIKLKPSAKRSMRTISCCVLDYLVYFIVYISNDGANTDKLLDTYFFILY